MRLLGQGDSVRRLDAIGMPADMLARFREILGRSAGMVLVTGPTGSGKTSTLYAALSEIDAETQKIITVEDPIEYRLPGLTQVQVNDKIDLDFARVLRATLRQDPDVILVGEMRDAETALIGLRAALTGHLVLSTLHTRDAISTPFRLLDMGAPPFMVASSLQAVIAQRLVRQVCENCAEPSTPTPQERAWLDVHGVDPGPSAAGPPQGGSAPSGGSERSERGGPAAAGPPQGGSAPSGGSERSERGGLFMPKRGRGCSTCNGTGYAGRVGVYEMLEMDTDLAHAATEADPGRFTALAKAQLAGRTLAHRACDLVRAGRTSVAEAMRLASDVD
jgi:MSHA biogenesis protein MshE